MHKLNLVGLLWAILLVPMYTQAQQVRQLTLKEAVALAKENSNQLRTDSLQIAISKQQTKQQASAMLPQLQLNASYRRLSNNITPFTITLPDASFQINPQILDQSYNSIQLTQNLYQGGRLKNMHKSLQKVQESSELDFQQSQLNIEDQVVGLWYHLHNAHLSKEILNENIETLKKKEEEMDLKKNQGIVLANDVLKISLSITNLQSSLKDVEELEASLNYTLCIATGLEVNTSIETPETEVVVPQDQTSVEDFITDAITHRPDIQSLTLQKEASLYRVKASKAGYLPVLQLMGSFSYDRPNQRIIPNVAEFNYSAYAGVGLSWNLSSFYTNQHNVKESQLAHAQITESIQLVKDHIEIEVQNKYLAYKKMQEKIALAEKALEQAEENFRVEQTKLDTQIATTTDFLEANTYLLQAELNLTTAKANAALAYQQLQIAASHTLNK